MLHEYVANLNKEREKEKEREREREDKKTDARARARELVLVYDIYIAHLLEVLSLSHPQGVRVFFRGVHGHVFRQEVAPVISGEKPKRSASRASVSFLLSLSLRRTFSYIDSSSSEERRVVDHHCDRYDGGGARKWPTTGRRVLFADTSRMVLVARETTVDIDMYKQPETIQMSMRQ